MDSALPAVRLLSCRTTLPKISFVRRCCPTITTSSSASSRGRRRNSARACSINSLPEPARPSSYHPLEEMDEPAPTTTASAIASDAPRLTDAEAARTIVEVNSNATVIFSGIIDDVHENIFWPDASYLTDEHGDIYFGANGDQDILQTLTCDDKLVQVIIGMDNVELLNEMEVTGPSDLEFNMVEDGDDESDDDYEGDLVSVLEEDEDDQDSIISSETLGDWANLETMRSSHPIYFAKSIAEVVSDSHTDWMDQPSAGIVLQGLLRPVFVDESRMSNTHPGFKATDFDIHQLRRVVGDSIEGQPGIDENLQSGTAFYKLELLNIQVISAYGSQFSVKVNDFRKATPDVLAHSATNIISRVKAGGDKMLNAFKSLCWRHKGIQVEEASITGVDSLGFDLRVCSGTQIQSLRFAFCTRATSEYSAERQLHELLFPKSHCKQQMLL